MFSVSVSVSGVQRLILQEHDLLEERSAALSPHTELSEGEEGTYC